jgi:3-methylfumaryl-CoA hydratase
MTAAAATADVQQWIGRARTERDTITPSPIARLAATLDRDDPPPRPGDAVPPLWHWLYFLAADRQGALGPDGHLSKGEFLPPFPLPRRMYAGGRFAFHRPLRVGAEAERRSEIVGVAEKAGRSGPLGFVTLRHTVSDAGGVCLVEEQDLVFRAAYRPGEPASPPQAPPANAAFGRRLAADPVLLFRYSALTFNGHRIHYDAPYVTGVEGYPGLIVHGPLLATLLADLVRREAPEAPLTRFAFRALRPVFDVSPFGVHGKRAGNSFALWATDNGGHLAMTAEASF